MKGYIEHLITSDNEIMSEIEMDSLNESFDIEEDEFDDSLDEGFNDYYKKLKNNKNIKTAKRIINNTKNGMKKITPKNIYKSYKILSNRKKK